MRSVDRARGQAAQQGAALPWRQSRASSFLHEQKLQREYYHSTASKYDEMHITAVDEHQRALGYISAFIQQLSIASVLDVGCGTGRGIGCIQQVHPDLKVLGVEPVPALLDIAVKKGTAPTSLVRGSGLALPFGDAAFDAVMALGVLHHVKYPDKVVGEMLRVARRAIFISDSNIFGQGKAVVWVAKLLLYRAGLWSVAKFIQTGGKGYMISAGDGLAYSYSAYFQYDLLASGADRIIVIPTGSEKKRRRWWSPVLTADTVLLCAIRDRIQI